ncbi:MAG TPA: GNAT family N-acetyltransferase [bacterium]|nr:GNAT family N-acetyltransferase [bacterium]HOL49535.1 GNAT family N-acetyltransferase [bacterium]HPO51977.1 GNAT family N-acetyltransferase [bacterium]
MNIEHPSKKEYEKIMQFLEESYDHSRGFFYVNYPQVMSKDTMDCDNIFLIREKNKIASLVSIFPQKVYLHGRQVNIGGIGSVSTHHDCRNRGYMKILMDFCIDEMKKRNYAFSILGGDRQRYNFWGYEICGTNAVITFSQRSFEKSGTTQTIPTFRYDGSKEILQKIKDVHEQMPCYVERSMKWIEKLFNERIHTQLYYTANKNGFAYVVAIGERIERKIVEIGGDKTLWCPLIYSLLKRWNNNAVDVLFPGNIPEFSVLLKNAAWFRIEPFSMIKILSFTDTMKFLFGKDFHYGCMLKMSETKEIIGDTGNKKIIEFDEKSWSRILFGPSFIETPDCLRKITPAQFYWWYLDHI